MTNSKVTEKNRFERSIIEQCLDEEGNLLDMLRDNQFDDGKYKKLVEAIIGYKEAIGNDTMINRQVAAWLWTIEMVFANTVAYYDWHDKDSETARKISRAHAEIWNLVEEILSVNPQ